MRKFFLSLTVLIASVTAFSQNLHLGVFGGIANYQGDLVDKYYVKQFIKPSVGVFANYELTEKFHIRGGYTFAIITGHDKFNTKDYLKVRNLNATTKISEVHLAGEYAPFSLEERRFTPYFFGGIAVYHFNPFTFDSVNNKVFLKPLSTEGQGLSQYPDRKPYGLTQFAIPFGGGLRYAVNDNIRVGLELGIRKLFTDYLDDVSKTYVDQADLAVERGQQSVDYSYRGDEVANGNPTYPEKMAQRGGEQQKDLYYLTGLTVSFRLGGSYGNGGGKNSRMGCPKVPLY